MKQQLANLSTDLRRVSYWIYGNNNKLASKQLDKINEKYDIKQPIGPYNNIWDEINKVKTLKGGNIRAADRASTISSVLLQESLKG